MAKYDIGNKVRFTGTFTDPLNSDSAVDPTTVTVSVKAPKSGYRQYVYPDSAITKSSTGVYYIDISLDEAGAWYIRWWSTGTGQAAEEYVVNVVSHDAM